MLLSVQVCQPGCSAGYPPPMEVVANPSHAWKGCTWVVSTVQAITTFLKLGVVIFFLTDTSFSLITLLCRNKTSRHSLRVFFQFILKQTLCARFATLEICNAKGRVFPEQKCLSGVWLPKYGSKKLRDISCPRMCLKQWAENKRVSNLPLCISAIVLCSRTWPCPQPSAISDNDREILSEEKTHCKRPCYGRQPCDALHPGSSQPVPFWQFWLEGQLFNSWGNFIKLLCGRSSLPTHRGSHSVSQNPDNWGRERHSERTGH